MAEMCIDIDEPYRSLASTVLVRLCYLYPHLKFSYQLNAIRVEGVQPSDEIQVKRDISHALYREKIYEETLPLRTALIQMVSKS
jgi:hypothetical protein